MVANASVVNVFGERMTLKVINLLRYKFKFYSHFENKDGFIIRSIYTMLRIVCMQIV